MARKRKTSQPEVEEVEAPSTEEVFEIDVEPSVGKECSRTIKRIKQLDSGIEASRVKITEYNNERDNLIMKLEGLQSDCIHTQLVHVEGVWRCVTCLKQAEVSINNLE